jgi:hypothetical protein
MNKKKTTLTYAATFNTFSASLSSFSQSMKQPALKAALVYMYFYEAMWSFCLALFASLFLSFMFVVGLLALTVGMVVTQDDTTNQEDVLTTASGKKLTAT